MKLISEKVLRETFKAAVPKVYALPKDAILSPAAKEYLNQLKVCLVSEREALGTTPSPASNLSPEKPEHMTHLDAAHLVVKSHPRIAFRGKLDSLQSQIIFVQTELCRIKAHSQLTSDLEEMLEFTRQVLRSEVLEVPLIPVKLLGLNAEELRYHSHHSQRLYKVNNMVPASYKMGTAYALLNLLRTEVREVELSAVNAFTEEHSVTHPDIIIALNRLSSALHVMMCRYLAGKY